MKFFVLSIIIFLSTNVYAPEILIRPSEKNPITAYANAKWESEKALNEICSDEFIVSSFRPSTVFGPSPRLRCDIVFNNFLASAWSKGITLATYLV